MQGLGFEEADDEAGLKYMPSIAKSGIGNLRAFPQCIYQIVLRFLETESSDLRDNISKFAVIAALMRSGEEYEQSSRISNYSILRVKGCLYKSLKQRELVRSSDLVPRAVQDVRRVITYGLNYDAAEAVANEDKRS